MKLIRFLSVFLLLISLSCPTICKETSIKVKSGHTFSIKLKANPTTGYLWQLAKPLDNNYVELVSSDYIPPRTKLVGAGNIEVWTFKAIKTGKTEIILQYLRPWEKVSSVEEKKFMIEIK